jgi:hypothetical protein
MRLIRDTFHGFGQRPFYQEAELDTMFENIVADYLKSKHGKISFPISTDDLTTLIEQDVADLDQFADLSCYGEGVEGVTEFPRAGKPRVLISEKVHRYENRLRTTLTHEYGHVRLHAYLFATAQRQLGFGSNRKPNTIYCMRDAMIPIGKRDWMEWQAGYASGAMLMPRRRLTAIVSEIQRKLGIYGAVPSESEHGREFISAVVETFAVSREAAAVRLKLLGFLGPEPALRSLFS